MWIRCQAWHIPTEKEGCCLLSSIFTPPRFFRTLPAEQGHQLQNCIKEHIRTLDNTCQWKKWSLAQHCPSHMQRICHTKDECLMLPNGDGLVLQSDHEALMKLYQRLELKLSLFFCREPALFNIFPLKPSFGLQVENELCHDSWGIKQITILWWFTDSGFAILCMCCNSKQWQLSEDLFGFCNSSFLFLFSQVSQSVEKLHHLHTMKELQNLAAFKCVTVFSKKAAGPPVCIRHILRGVLVFLGKHGLLMTHGTLSFCWKGGCRHLLATLREGSCGAW